MRKGSSATSASGHRRLPTSETGDYEVATVIVHSDAEEEDPRPVIEDILGTHTTDNPHPERLQSGHGPHIPYQLRKDLETAVLSWRSYFVVLTVAVLGEASRGLVVPSMWPYFRDSGGDLEMYGVATAAFSLSRMIAAPLFGWWSDSYHQAHRHVMLLACALLVVGNYMYAMYPSTAPFIASRFIVGLGAGTLGQARGYVGLVAKPFPREEARDIRTKLLAWLSSSQFAAAAASPGVAAALYFADFSVLGVQVNQYSAPGFLLATLAVLMFGAMFFVFTEPRAWKEPTNQVDTERAQGHRRQISTIEAITGFTPIEVQEITACILIMLCSRFAVSVLENDFVIYTRGAYGWSVEKNSLFVAMAGCAGFVLLVALPRILRAIHNVRTKADDPLLARAQEMEPTESQNILPPVQLAEETNGTGLRDAHAPDVLTLLFGVVFLAVGFFLMTPRLGAGANEEPEESAGSSAYLPEWRVLLGASLVWGLGYALTQTLTNVLLSELMAKHKQSMVMGSVSSLGSLARIVAALWASFALEFGGWSLVFGSTGLMAAVTVVLSTLAFRTWHLSREWVRKVRASHRHPRTPARH